MPKIYEHDKNILEAEERRRTFTLLYKIMEIICVSANVKHHAETYSDSPPPLSFFPYCALFRTRHYSEHDEHVQDYQT